MTSKLPSSTGRPQASWAKNTTSVFLGLVKSKDDRYLKAEDRLLRPFLSNFLYRLTLSSIGLAFLFDIGLYFFIICKLLNKPLDRKTFVFCC